VGREIGKGTPKNSIRHCGLDPQYPDRAFIKMNYTEKNVLLDIIKIDLKWKTY